MINYVTETDLKGFIPELTKYLWNGETTFTAQKTQAEQTVISDLTSKGYLIRQLQPKFTLDITGAESVEDNINALRFVCQADEAGTIELLGSNDNETFETITTLTFTALNYATVQSYYITNPYKYYAVNTTHDGYNAYLVELTYDRLFAYKWLELILMDAYSQENDAYYLKMLYFQSCYNDLLNNMTIAADLNDDGTISDDELSSSSIVNFKR